MPFTLTTPGELANFNTALARNRTFSATGEHERASALPNLRTLVVTCADPRVDPAHVLGLDLGDAAVIRNTGGRVTKDVHDDIAFISQLVEESVPEGPLLEVAIIHHTQCAARALAEDTFRRRYALRIGAEETALRERAILDPVATVANDVELLLGSSSISRRFSVSGHVYDVVTGIVETVVPPQSAVSPREAA